MKYNVDFKILLLFSFIFLGIILLPLILNKTTKNIIADYLKSTRTIASFLSEIENNLLNSHKSTIDNLYMDKIKGLVDEEMYKRIYDKTNKEITRINM